MPENVKSQVYKVCAKRTQEITWRGSHKEDGRMGEHQQEINCNRVHSDTISINYF